MENLDVNAAIWGIFIFRHSANCSSSWTRLFRKFTSHQSVHTITETIVSNTWETDYGSNGNYLCSRDRLARAKVAMDNRPCSQDRSAQTFVFSDSVLCPGGIRETSGQIPSEHGRSRLIGSWNRQEADEARVEYFPRMHCSRDPHRDSKVMTEIKYDT